MRAINSFSLGFTLIEFLIAIAIIGLLAAIAIPQYQAYVFKSQVQRVIGEVGSLRPAVELCLLNGEIAVGPLPTNCDPQATGSNLQTTAGNAAPNISTVWNSIGTGVPEITLSATEISTIVATFGNFAARPLQMPKAGTITWTRLMDGSWDCRAANIERRYASATCPL